MELLELLEFVPQKKVHKDSYLDKSLDKVSAVEYVSNIYDTQNVRGDVLCVPGDVLCVRGEKDGDMGPSTLLDLSDRQTEGAGEAGQDDEGGCGS